MEKAFNIEWQHENLSFVDPLTNDVNIPSIDLEDLDNLLNGRCISAKHLPIFLHESTHNWCFQSIVGDAMAIAEAHASIAEQTLFNRSLQVLKYDDRRLEDFLLQERDEVDLINQTKLKLVAAKKLFSPFLEGLALFIEFDLLPNKPLILPPALWCQRLFAKQNADNAEFLDYLKRLRKDKTRKLNVFLSSFEFKTGGHLRGYLFIKSIHNYLRKNYGERLDDEAFVFFLKSFFLDCPRIGNLFLQIEKDHYEFFKSLKGILKEKFGSLYNIATYDNRIDHRVRSFISDNYHKADFLIVAPHDKELFDRVGDLLRANYSYFNLNVDGTDLPEDQREELNLLESLYASAFTIRRYVRILSHKCQVFLSVEKDCLIISVESVGSFKFIVDDTRKYKEHDGYGSVDVYAHYSLDIKFFIFSITDSPILIAKQERGGPISIVEDPLNRFPTLYRKLNIKSFANPGKFVFSTGFENEIIKYDRIVSHYLNRFYSVDYCPLHSIENAQINLDKLRSGLKEDGFYNLFNSLALVETLLDMEDGCVVDEKASEKVMNMLVDTRRT